jgi:hypothetical protein
MHPAETAVARIIFIRNLPNPESTLLSSGISLYQTKDFDKTLHPGSECGIGIIPANHCVWAQLWETGGGDCRDSSEMEISQERLESAEIGLADLTRKRYTVMFIWP